MCVRVCVYACVCVCVPSALNTSLHQLTVAMSRVTYFILRAHTGIDVSHSHHRKNSGEILEKMQVNGPEG